MDCYPVYGFYWNANKLNWTELKHNKLPNNIKQIENINQFKKKLKELLIKGCYYSIDDYLNKCFLETGYWFSW
jgi:hypothetical protein